MSEGEEKIGLTITVRGKTIVGLDVNTKDFDMSARNLSIPVSAVFKILNEGFERTILDFVPHDATKPSPPTESPETTTGGWMPLTEEETIKIRKFLWGKNID